MTNNYTNNRRKLLSKFTTFTKKKLTLASIYGELNIEMQVMQQLQKMIQLLDGVPVSFTKNQHIISKKEMRYFINSSSFRGDNLPYARDKSIWID